TGTAARARAKTPGARGVQPRARGVLYGPRGRGAEQAGNAHTRQRPHVRYPRHAESAAPEPPRRLGRATGRDQRHDAPRPWPRRYRRHACPLHQALPARVRRRPERDVSRPVGTVTAKGAKSAEIRFERGVTSPILALFAFLAVSAAS